MAKTLVNQGIYVDIFPDDKGHILSKIRTLGISKSNVEFFNQYISNINKLSWNINKIEIYSEKLNKEKILSFKNKDKFLFSIIKNDVLYNFLFKELKKNKYLKIKKFTKDCELISKNYDLVFNCDQNNQLSKSFFLKK